ncbi:MAG: histidine kinase [Sphingomonas bacterium]|jgi:two-component sensor histidine kinase|nr:histidine kinase [Sphingomonas bacterium]MDB5717665.1 histidine kinase [Sphingomonas bacterium]
MVVEYPRAPGWHEHHLRLAIEAACVALWSWNVDDDRFAMDERAFELWGLPWADKVSFEELSAHIHPADRDRVRAAFTATRSVAGAYEIDFRIMIGDEIRWISARGQGADQGIVDRFMFGIFLDVTGRKQAEEGSELLAGEMSHRVKNLLSIATGLTQLTARNASSVAQMAGDLTQRLTSLGRAHDVVRPLPGNQGKAALLGDLLSVLLAPYDETAAFSGRIRVAVPRMGVGERTATTLAMVVHELATNSVKYGALSCAEGFLDVSSRLDNDYIDLVWAETGGPAITESPELSGFGSRLVARSVGNQLGGELNYNWLETGLVVTVRIRQDRLAA